MKKLFLSLPCCALLLVGACKGNSLETPPTVTETTAAHTSLSSKDREFVTTAAQGGVLEVELGKQVSPKATSAEVRAFADQMVVDHAKANVELRAIAQKKGLQLAEQLDKTHQDKIDDIAKLPSDQIDQKYVADMVSDHEKDVKDFKKASEESKDADVRAFAAKTLPTLEHHLGMIKELQTKMEKK